MRNNRRNKILFWVGFIIYNIFFYCVLRYTEVGQQFTGAMFTRTRNEEILTRPENTRLELAFKELRYGMSKEEVVAIVEKYTREIKESGVVEVYTEWPEIEEMNVFDKNNRGTLNTYVTWRNFTYDVGMSIACMGPRPNELVLVADCPAELFTCFDEKNKLYLAIYQCQVTHYFPEKDLVLREDGVHPYNNAHHDGR